MILTKSVFVHPVKITSGTAVEVFQAAAAAQGRTHLIGGGAVEAAVLEAGEKGLIINEALAKGNGAYPIGRGGDIGDQGGLVLVARQLDVIGVCDASRDGGHPPCGLVEVFAS